MSLLKNMSEKFGFSEKQKTEVKKGAEIGDLQAFIDDYSAAYGPVSPEFAAQCVGSPSYKLWKAGFARSGGIDVSEEIVNGFRIVKNDVMVLERLFLKARKPEGTPSAPTVGVLDAIRLVQSGEANAENAARACGMHPQAFAQAADAILRLDSIAIQLDAELKKKAAELQAVEEAKPKRTWKRLKPAQQSLPEGNELKETEGGEVKENE